MKRSQLHGTRMLEAEADIPFKRRQELVDQALQNGLESAWSITDRSIPLFDRNPMLNGKYSSATTFLGVPFQEDMRALVQQLVESGEVAMDGIGSDIADPDVVESAYSQTPLAPLLTLFDAAGEFAADLPRVTQPLLLMNSPQDHVVPPTDSDLLAESVSGPVERVSLERSYHVATQDYDKDLIIERALDFVARHSG